MSIIEKMTKIINDGDVAAGEQMIHDDYQFLMHSSGNKLGKQDILKWLGMKDVKKEKVRVWVIKKEKKFKQKVQLNPLDSSLGTIVSESAVRTKTIVSFTSPSGSVANSVGTIDPDGTIVQVTPLNGYLPTHNKFTSDLTTGMENLYFKGCKQTQATTLDGTPPVEVFTTNPNLSLIHI